MNKGVIAVVVALVVAVGGYFGLQQYTNQQASQAVQERVDEMNAQSSQKVEYGNVSTGLFSDQVTISDIVFKNQSGTTQSTIKEVVISSSSFDETLPNQMKVDIIDMRPKNQLDQRPQLKELLKDEPIDVSVSYLYNEDKQTLSSNFSSNVDTLGEMSGALNLGGMQATWAELKAATKEKRSVQFQSMGLQNVLLDNINFSLNDKGIIDKALEAEAKRLGVDKEQLKKQRLRQIRSNPQMPEEVAKKFETFLSTSNPTINIDINPSNDVPLMRIPQLFLGQRNKNAFLEQFNVNITVE